MNPEGVILQHLGLRLLCRIDKLHLMPQHCRKQRLIVLLQGPRCGRQRLNTVKAIVRQHLQRPVLLPKLRCVPHSRSQQNQSCKPARIPHRLQRQIDLEATAASLIANSRPEIAAPHALKLPGVCRTTRCG